MTTYFQWLAMLICLLSTAYQAQAQVAPARSLDSLLQDYAYRAFHRPRTGTPYLGQAPSNLTGVKIAAIRLRRSSLRTRGLNSYNEFHFPTGVVVQPHIQRLALVYHNLGNWSSVYYPLPGYTYLAPVLGLLAYEAANLSATGLPELDLLASGLPITVNFANLSSKVAVKCVWFDLDGSPEFSDVATGGVCSTYRGGHFSVVVSSTGVQLIPTQSDNDESKAWKVIGGVVGGFLGLILVAVFLVCLFRSGRDRKMMEMERRSDAGEALRGAQAGNSRALVASGTRTQPVLEEEYFA